MKKSQLCVHVGFTGTRAGMTPEQEIAVSAFLTELREDFFSVRLHHGDCKGADAQAHQLATFLEIPVVIHPPEKSALRAFCQVDPHVGGELLPPKDYLERDRDIVQASMLVIGTPGESFYRQRGSGTWYTLKYASIRLGPHRTEIYAPDGRRITLEEAMKAANR